MRQRLLHLCNLGIYYSAWYIGINVDQIKE